MENHKKIYLGLMGCFMLCVFSCKNEPKTIDSPVISKKDTLVDTTNRLQDTLSKEVPKLSKDTLQAAKPAPQAKEKPIETAPKEKSTPKQTQPAPKKLTPLQELIVGKIQYAKDARFVKVPSRYATKTIYIQNEVWLAFEQMANAAAQEGIQFKIISGARNFAHQKSIWERKWKKYASLAPVERSYKILEYSSMPMTSRHHWGTDIDINSLNNAYFSSGKGLQEYNWLLENASKYGFCQVYTHKTETGRTGYNEEKWHWSYMPLAAQYLEMYNQQIDYEMIQGFQGSEWAKEVDIIQAYVNGIGCKNWQQKQD